MKHFDLLLYGVTDRQWLGNHSLAEDVEQALRGGVTILQYREKYLQGDELLHETRELQNICRKYQVPFLINDDVLLAKKMGADGVHVGQSDVSAVKAREILGDNAILGVSVSTVEQAKKAQENGADYLGVGAVFATSSKEDAKTLSHEVLRDICRAVHIPVVAIGGITKENVEELSDMGIAGVAVISAIFAQKDIYGETQKLKKAVEETVHGSLDI